MGVGAGKDPLGREASPSSWPIAPLGDAGALGQVRFQMTRAGSLPGRPLGGETAFSGEELCSSPLVGIFGWLAPAPSLLAGLPRTTLNRPPSASRLPTVESMSCFRRAAIKQGGGACFPVWGFLQRWLRPAAPAFSSPGPDFSLVFGPWNISYVWKLLALHKHCEEYIFRHRNSIFMDNCLKKIC